MTGDGELAAETGGAALLPALLAVLGRRGLVSEAEIEERVRLTDAATPAQGARMVARAWSDPDYRVQLLSDGAVAAEALGIPMRGMPPLGVLENRPGLHHLVVCTLCSCYPRAVLGYPPFWFKSAAYRARAVRDRAARWPSGAPVCRRGPACTWSTAPPTTAGWCCRCAPTTRMTGTRRG